MKKIDIIYFILLMLNCPVLCWSQSEGVPWIAIDDLGRITVQTEETFSIRENRTIGLFYFLWMLPESNIPPDPNGNGEPYDISKITTKDPLAFKKEDDTKFGKNGEMHFWGEPLYGYYDSRDPWVIRRHIQLIADAGVDVLLFDATNAATYPAVWRQICRIMKDMRVHGESTPQITFILHTNTKETVTTLWTDLYNTGQYDELLFRWEGKPLLVCNPEEVDDTLRDKFTFRRTRWQYEGMANMQKAWTWIATYPQPYSWVKDKNIPEQINVSVAQNMNRFQNNVELRKKTFKEATGWDCPEWLYSTKGVHAGAGLDSWMCDNTARGRSYWKNEFYPKNTPNEGRNFSEQWSRAYVLNPAFVMITGWNEWIAGRWKVAGHYIFIDQFNHEYSRDIEPMKGGHFDNYYLQMVNGIRKYKGMPSLPVLSDSGTTPVSFNFDRWQTIQPDFHDHVGETIPRDFDGVGKTHYKNESGRNDLISVKIARDENRIWFYLKTRNNIIPKTPDGLCLLIDSDNNLKTGWLGADLIIGRKYQEKTVSLEQFTGKKTYDWNWTAVAPSTDMNIIQWSIFENQMILAIPRSVFPNKSLDHLRFKWWDNVPENATPEDLYLHGDTTPESRFFYQVHL